MIHVNKRLNNTKIKIEYIVENETVHTYVEDLEG